MAENSTSFREAGKDVGFFAAVFSSVFGTPALVSLFQSLVIKRQLIIPVQEVIEGYHKGMQAFGSWVEPHLFPIFHWLNGLLGLHLHLYPHWRDLFVLAMVYAMAVSRTILRGLVTPAGIVEICCSVVGAFLGAIGAGLLSFDGSWWSQGLLAALPLAGVFFGSVAAQLVRGGVASAAGTAGTLGIIVIAIFSIAVGLHFFSSLRTTAAILTLFGWVVLIGIVFLWGGYLEKSARSVNMMRMGLTLLGAPFWTALIFVADWAIR